MIKLLAIFVLSAFLFQKAHAQQTGTDRILVQDGLDEFRLVLFEDKDKNGIRVYHEPLYYLLNYSNHSAIYYEVEYSVANKANFLDLYFTLTSSRIQASIKTLMNEKNIQPITIDPILPARTLAVLKDESGNSYQSVKLDGSVYEVNDSIGFFRFEIPYEKTEAVQKSIKNKKCILEIYYAYPGKKDEVNSVSYENKLVFPPGFLDNFFQGRSEVTLTKAEFNQLRANATENVEIYGYFYKLDLVLLEDLFKGLSKNSNLQNQAEKILVTRESLEKIERKVIQSVQSTQMTVFAMAIRNFQDNHIYLQDLSGKFFSDFKAIKARNVIKKSKKADPAYIFQDIRVSTSEHGLTLENVALKKTFQFLIDEDFTLNFFAEGKAYHGYVFSIETGEYNYVFRLDKKLAFVSQDISNLNRMNIVHLSSKNIFIQRDSTLEGRLIYSCPKDCHYKYGVIENGQLQIQNCRSEEVFAL